jgi:hypothetical protein
MPHRGFIWKRCVLATFLFCALPLSFDASVFHWITKLGHTSCDNHPVAPAHSRDLLARSEHPDLDELLRFEAERPFASGSALELVVCNGEIRVHPGPDADKLRVSVRLGSPLGHELTPGRFLQVFSVDSHSADIEWKLPERVHPVIDIYVPRETNLNLALGKTDLEIRDVVGDKTVNAGKGTVRLAVANDKSEYRSIVVDVALGSFSDLRPEGESDHHTPLHKEFSGEGTATAHLQMAMGRVEITPE